MDGVLEDTDAVVGWVEMSLCEQCVFGWGKDDKNVSNEIIFGIGWRFREIVCTLHQDYTTTNTTLICDCVVVVVLSSDNFSLSQSIVRHFERPWNFNKMELGGEDEFTSHFTVCFVAGAWFFFSLFFTPVYQKKNNEEIWRLKASIPYLIHVYIFPYHYQHLPRNFPSLFFLSLVPCQWMCTIT